MKSNIHFFNESEFATKETILDRIGVRGRSEMELASMKLPIIPGFIIDASVSAELEEVSIIPHLKKAFAKIEPSTGKIFGDAGNPMLVKIVISPNIVITAYPSLLHDYGLVKDTLDGFSKFVGPHFAHHEVLFLFKGNLTIEAKIAELENRSKDMDKLDAAIKSIDEDMSKDLSLEETKTAIEKYKPLLPVGFFDDAYGQLEIAIKRISRLLKLDVLEENDTAILIQPMVYGNYGKDSASGMFYTRNINTGEKKLQGEFYQGKFDDIGAEGQDINGIMPAYLKKLQKTATQVEDHFKEIRSIRFTIENKKLWLIDQRPVMTKSTQSDIKTLLDLLSRKKVDSEYVIRNIKPTQLIEVLHPVVDSSSTKNLKVLEGGISGAPGAAVGRIFFSTKSLLDAYKAAQQKDMDTSMILCMSATFAEDVKAIEVSTGVLSNEGGYAAHASVVARQYGKVSLVKPELRIRGNKAMLGNLVFSEGDYITLNVPNHGEPQIFLGKAELIEPDPEESGLLDLISLIKPFIKGFHVRANADSPKDAKLALSFGAEGIGLCRTEHMFFQENRINLFREMILSDTKEERIKALSKLKPIQKVDFYKIFKTMEGKEVTIRLLDAPLHEFLPHNIEEMDTLVEYMNKGSKKLARKEIQARCDTLDEFNPMLGHRGCRIAVSFPEIYEMQMSAIFEAVYSLQKEGINVHPEIMVPLIMNSSELKLIIYGKKIEGQSIKGLVDVEEEVRKKMAAKPVPYKIGTMIELPVAALGAGEIARYAEFFSFGTNDLTQTATGISRDDFNSFMPDYTQFDILESNPFQILNDHVKELVALAVQRGKMTRPNIKLGLCGEHGAVPENIQFCMESGLNYVSCSSYSVPVANLAVAQFSLENVD